MEEVEDFKYKEHKSMTKKELEDYLEEYTRYRSD